MGTCMAFVSADEGGKNYTGEANGQYTMLNPADKGGPTNRGVTKDTLLAAYAQGIMSNSNLDTLWKLVVDGKFGPKTFEAIQRTSEAQPKEFTGELLGQQKQFYDEIVARDETQKKNLNGWYNRIKRLAEAAGIASPV